MPDITYGCESTLANQEPTLHWCSTKDLREESIRLAREHCTATAKNTEVCLRRVLRLVDGSIHVELGSPALHVQWRRTRFRASHRTRHAYHDQLALVDVINGHVIIVDPKNPFEVSHYKEWSRDSCLQELIPYSAHEDSPGDSFWPKVRPAHDGERCHYVVIAAADCATLKTKSRSTDYFAGTGPYKVPAFR